jgi:hypothetical protein
MKRASIDTGPMVKKTYDEELDNLIYKLLSPWDGGPSAGDEYVVSADIAHDAALKLIEMFERIEGYEAEHYNQQIGG